MAGYDDLSVSEIRAVMDEGDEERIKRARAYKRSQRTKQASSTPLSANSRSRNGEVPINPK